MRQLATVLATAALVMSLAAPAAPSAQAGGYGHKGHGGHGYGGYRSHGYSGYSFSYRHYGGHRRHGGHYGHGYKHSGHDHYGYAVAGALVGGVVLGHLLTRPAYPHHYPVATTSRLGNCRPTTGTGSHYGRPARFSGIMCYDAAGTGFVRNDSVRFVEYLD